MNLNSKTKICVIGLGYVGLPLLLELSKKFEVIGYDTSKSRLNSLKKGKDLNYEINNNDLKRIKKINLTSNSKDIKNSNCYIITVPTPIKKNKKPDLNMLLNATRSVAKNLNKKDIIIYESTVFPGLTEEICVPEIEKISKLKYKVDFFCGYSPERINPGDKTHNLTKIKKIVSASNNETLKFVSKLYGSIIKAGVHRVSSIKVAEAAKVIENTQRDLNIALMNELSIIFNKMNIDTREVINAAATKWNFIKFEPGLVGGHCISVDPYYLTFKSRLEGYEPKVILAGRKINDDMGTYVANQSIQILKFNNISLKNSKVLILGASFKENCADVRNSQVLNIYKKLKINKMKIDIYDPIANEIDILKYFKIKKTKILKKKNYNLIIIAVSHKEFIKLGLKKIRKYLKKPELIIDVKGIFDKKETIFRL